MPTDTPPLLIDLQHIGKSYDSVHALQDVTLALQPGAIGLLGPNGAGKSTLIKTLLGLVDPDQGSGNVLGYNIRTQQLDLRLRIGYMPETDCYFDDMTGVRYVAYLAELAGIPPTVAMQRAHEMLDFVGMEEARYRQLGTYSMGMKQRVKLAQAIVHDPQLLFLDEPTNGMDPQGRQDMLRLIRHLARRAGMSVILCSHIMPDVEFVCDTVVFINKGRVLRTATMAEIRATVEPVYFLKVQGNVPDFRQALLAEGFSCEPMDDAGTLQIAPPALETWSTAVFQAAQRTQTHIRSLLQKRQSLEELFLATVKGAGNANL